MENRQEKTAWEWFEDNSIVIDLTEYHLSAFRKQGMSIVKAARDWADSADRRDGSIKYLVKFGRDAIAERLYYRAARYFNLPQQNVLWATFSELSNPDFIACAIQFEHNAFFPKRIIVQDGDVIYRNRRISIPNIIDFTRHGALHTYMGSVDVHQAMVMDGLLFGIDAADCKIRTTSIKLWKRLLESNGDISPVNFSAFFEMLKTISASDIVDVLKNELRAYPISAIAKDLCEYYFPMVDENHANLNSVLKNLQV